MTLSEVDVIAAGNAALRLLELPERAELSSSDAEFAFVGIRLADGEGLVGSNGIWWDGDIHDAVILVLDGLTNDLSETDAYWGVAFPRCAGHGHPADYGTDDRGVWLRCPATGEEIGRVCVQGDG